MECNLSTCQAAVTLGEGSLSIPANDTDKLEATVVYRWFQSIVWVVGGWGRRGGFLEMQLEEKKVEIFSSQVLEICSKQSVEQFNIAASERQSD